MLISTKRDIEVWIATTLPSVHTTSGVERLAQALDAAEHPPYGTDWREWFASNEVAAIVAGAKS